MDGRADDEQPASAGKRRRWFVSLQPIFESGRQGRQAQAWDVEDELIAVAALGDVTIDLSTTKSTPEEIAIDAYAILRDVDVFVAADDHVELFGGVLRGDLRNDVPAVPEERRHRVIRVHGHSLLGDVTVRVAQTHS